MKKDASFFLGHILESIRLIERYATGISEEGFLSDIGVQDKVIRRLSVIGEAASQIPEEIRLVHADVKWREIIGMRNFLIHEYFGVALREVWLTVKRDLPELRDQIERIQDTMSDETPYDPTGSEKQDGGKLF